MNKRISYLVFLFIFQTNVCAEASQSAVGKDELEVQINQQELSVTRIRPQVKSVNQSDLIIWVAPGYGTDQRALDISAKLAELGIENWHVDLAESLFLPKGTGTMRRLDGKYLEKLIEYAHAKTSKRITLLTRSYGAIPVLRALREWQLQYSKSDNKNFYLQGAILFSPELYSKVPELGLEPEFVNIIEATNMPLMIFQGGKRGNRWQLSKVLNKLQSGGAPTYVKILEGLNGVLYSGDESAEALKQQKLMPKKIQSILVLLAKTPKPKQAAALKEPELKLSHPLDSKLKLFKGTKTPHSLDLVDVLGKRYKKTDYKGKVTVVNFWATWCPPCVQEIPSLNHLRELMKGQNFELISINYGEDKQAVQDFMKKVNVDFPVLLDPTGEQAAIWKVLVFPSTFVIDTDGKVRYGVNAAIHWDKASVVNELKALSKQAK